MSTKSVINRVVRTHYVSGVQANDPEPGVSYTQTSSTTSLTNLRTTTPDTIPGWRAKIASGRSASTELLGSKIRTSRYFGHSEMISKSKTASPGLWKRDVVIGSGFLSGNYSYYDPIDESLRQRALQKFLAKYQSNITQFQGGVFAGEIRETLQLITRPGKLLRNGLDDYLRRAKRHVRNARDPRHAADLLSREWLTYRFGVQPLLQDIEGGAQALGRMVADRRLRTPISAYAKSTSSTPFTIFGGSSFGNMRLDYLESTSSELSYTYRGSMWLDTGTPTAAISSLGFSPENWLPTVWELIPYSFVIDYFTNVGDLINAFSFGTGQLTWSLLTRRGIQVRKRRASSPTQSNPFYDLVRIVSDSPAESTVVSQHIARELSPSLVPSFTFRIPGVESTRWINLAALVASRGRANTDRI